MIHRAVTEQLIGLFQQFPVVTITGPRQSGKTTLAHAAFPNLAYRNLEDPVKDLVQFQRFLALCAGRMGQILNLSSLADHAGVSHKTAGERISLLETSFVQADLFGGTGAYQTTYSDEEP